MIRACNETDPLDSNDVEFITHKNRLVISITNVKNVDVNVFGFTSSDTPFYNAAHIYHTWA